MWEGLGVPGGARRSIVCSRGFLPEAQEYKTTGELDWLWDGKKQSLAQAGRDVPDKG